MTWNIQLRGVLFFNTQREQKILFTAKNKVFITYFKAYFRCCQFVNKSFITKMPCDFKNDEKATLCPDKTGKNTKFCQAR